MPLKFRSQFFPLVLIPTSLFLLLFSGFIPNQRINSMIKSDAQENLVFLSDYPGSRDKIHVKDQYTECIALSMGQDSTHPDRWFASFQGYMLGNCLDIGQTLNLNYEQNPNFSTGSASEQRPYSRFWHGYQIVTRPILAIGGWSLLTGVLTIGLAISIYILLRIADKANVGFALEIQIVVFFFALDIQTLFDSPHALIQLITFYATFCCIIQSIVHNASLVSVFVAGYFVNFFSMFTNQGVLVVLATSVIAISVQRSENYWRGSRVAVALIAGWCSSQVLRFVFWLLWASPEEISRNISSSTLFASLPQFADRGRVWKVGFTFDQLSNYWNELGIRSNIAYSVAVGGFALSALFILINRRKKDLARLIQLQMALFLSFLSWITIFATHTSLHAIFTWRLLPALCAGSASLSSLFLLENVRVRGSRKQHRIETSSS